jgi:probable F420-dependent oxidoreductase
VRLGLAVPHYDTSLANHVATWGGISHIARTAEEAGFDSLWVSDHLFLDWSKYGGSGEVQGSFECWTTLSALAAITSRVRLGSLALCNDLRNPGLVAKMATTLDLLSRGRLELGIGGGWYEPEFRAAGIEFDSARVRIRRLGEAVEILGRLLAGEEVTYKGDYYTMDGAVCLPAPRQRPRPPIWVGGKGDLLIATAARTADGWNYSWLGDEDTYRARVRTADDACEAAGRDPSSLRRSVGAYVLVGRDDADLRHRFDRLRQRTPIGVLTAVSFDEFRTRGVVGTVDEVADRLGRLGEMRVEDVVVSAGALPFQVADEDDVELLGTEVAPALRRS